MIDVDQILKSAEKALDEFAKTPHSKGFIEAMSFLTVMSFLGPSRLRKGADVIQKIKRGEKLTYRDGSRLTAAISTVALTVATTTFEGNRHMQSVRNLINYRDARARSAKLHADVKTANASMRAR